MTASHRNALEAVAELNASDLDARVAEKWRMVLSLRDIQDDHRARAWERLMDADIDGGHRDGHYGVAR